MSSRAGSKDVGAWALWIIASVAGCGPEIQLIPVDPPGPGETLLVAIERQESDEEFNLEDVFVYGDPSLRYKDAELEDIRLRITAIRYSASNEELGLEPGVLVRDLNGCYALTNIQERAPSAVLTGLVFGGESTVFTLTAPEDLGPDVRSFRLSGACDGCAWLFNRYDLERGDFPTPASASFALPADGGAVLVGLPRAILPEAAPEDALIRLDPDGTISSVAWRRDRLPPQLRVVTASPAWGGLVDPRDGRYWLAGRDGDVWIGRLEAESSSVGSKFSMVLEERTKTQSPITELRDGELVSRARWMAASKPGEPFELFARSVEGRFERYADGAWDNFGFDGLEYAESRNFSGGVARVGPGEAIGVGISDIRVARVRNGSVRLEEVGDPTLGGLSTAAVIEGVGTLVGSQGGKIFRYEAGTWTLAWETGSSVEVIVDHPEGFLVSGTNGYLGRYVRLEGRSSLEVCHGALAFSGRFIAPIGGDGELLVTGPKLEESPLLGYVRLRPKLR